MTNKEAKEKLYKEWQKFLEENIDYAGISEAYKMAFKALEQEPKGINFWDLDDNDDCISRKAVLSLLADHFDNVFDMVIELPSVAIPSVELKTGHWIKTISENGITSAVRCSECGFEDNRYMLFRYCPNCGAKMVYEQERNEQND